MPVDLPPPLRAAIASDHGSQVTVVIGAGCSLEPPTSLPLSTALAARAYGELVANGEIAADACDNPEDLSALAQAVIVETGSQEPLVRALPRHRFQSAEPNRGYRIAAVLLREGAIGDVITLNFDLAQSIAIGQMGGSDDVVIINGPEFHRDLGRHNVIYLHRNVTNANAEDWILTTDAMKAAWENNSWEAVVVKRSAAVPVVLFAGLGSPADVLQNSVREIRREVKNEVYLAEPGDVTGSRFFDALGIEVEQVIRAGWVDLMDALGERVAMKHRQMIMDACLRCVALEGWHITGWNGVRAFLEGLDLLDLGSLRANWTLSHSRYSKASGDISDQLSALFAVLEITMQSTGYHPSISSNGVVTFSDDEHRIRGNIAFVSGRGCRSAFSIEPEIEAHRKYADLKVAANVYVVTGVTGNPREIVPPKDIATEEIEDDLIGGWRDWSLVLAHDICSTGNIDEIF